MTATADGEGAVSRLLADLADRTRLTAQLGEVLTGLRKPRARHDPGSDSGRHGGRSGALLEAGLTVFVIVSRQVTALRSRYGTTGNKDDRFDAYLLADVLRTDRRRLTPLSVDSPATVGLRMLIRTRQDLVKARVAAHNQLRAHLQLAHPGVVGLFHQLDGKISLAFLTRFPAPRHTRWLSKKRLATWLSAAHYARPGTRTPAQLSDHLRQAPAAHAERPAADAAETITLELITLLRSLRERITAIEKTIDQALRAHADQAVFTSLPRSGSVRAATMLAEIGDAAATPPTKPSPPQPGSRPRPARRDGLITSRSAAASTTGCARPRSTSPTAAERPIPGPRTYMRGPELAGTNTPTPCGSSPAPGSASSGAAGPNTAPMTPPGMWPWSRAATSTPEPTRMAS